MLPERPSKYYQLQDKVPEQFIDMLRDKKAKEAILKVERELEVFTFCYNSIKAKRQRQILLAKAIQNTTGTA